MKQLKFLFRLLLPVIGIICIVFPGHVTRLLPFLLGGSMLLTGVIHIIGSMRTKAFLESAPPDPGRDLILAVMGVAFLFQGENAIGLMGITWGLIGIREAMESINETVRLFYNKERAWLSTLESALRLCLALALLFDPFEKFSFHIVLLGLELIVTNIKFPNHSADA